MRFSPPPPPQSKRTTSSTLLSFYILLSGVESIVEVTEPLWILILSSEVLSLVIFSFLVSLCLNESSVLFFNRNFCSAF